MFIFTLAHVYFCAAGAKRLYSSIKERANVIFTFFNDSMLSFKCVISALGTGNLTLLQWIYV